MIAEGRVPDGGSTRSRNDPEWTVREVEERAWSMPVAEVCIEPEAYAMTALPECLWRENCTVNLHCGLFAEHKLMSWLPNVIWARELPRPHLNLQERFFRIDRDVLVSNIVGPTRLLHNLVLLRLLGVPRERVRVFDEQTDFSDEYERAVRGVFPKGSIDRLVLSFNSMPLADAVRNHLGCGQLESITTSLLRGVALQTPGSDTLFVHLTSVYGTQCPLLMKALRERFSLQEVVVFGACGALSPDLPIQSFFLPDLIMDPSGEAFEFENIFAKHSRDLARWIQSEKSVHSGMAASVASIPSETRPELVRVLKAGGQVVDLELGPIATWLRRCPEIRLGALLHVSDCPLRAGQQLPGLAEKEEDRAERTRAQAQLLCRSSSPFIRPKEKTQMKWTQIDGTNALRIWETSILDESNRRITVHALPLNLKEFKIVPAVNPAGEGFIWKEEIVRGMRAWDPAQMEIARQQFRRSPQDFLKDFVGQCRPSAMLNGNANLFWNLGHFTFLKGRLYHHFKEALFGNHTALIGDYSGLRIGTIDFRVVNDSCEFALGGPRILRNGQVVNLLSIDPDTQRPITAEFLGDFTHILHGFRLSVSLSRRTFSENVDMNGHGNSRVFTKTTQLSHWLSDAVAGYPVTCKLDSDDEPAAIREACLINRYQEQTWGTQLKPGEFALDKSGFLAIAFRRGTLGHSIIVSTADPEMFLIINTYTDETRKGFTIEETARRAKQIAESLGFQARDALMLASSGDPRIILFGIDSMSCIEQNRDGETLLFKGGIGYGLSSVLFVTPRH